MDEKIVLLNEDDLDSIVGGAFNQKADSSMGLEVRTAKSGAQALMGEMACSKGQFPDSFSQTSKKGVISEASLRSALAEYDTVSVSVKTTSGESKTLSSKELSSLLS